MYSTTWTFKCHIHSSHIMRCIHKFGIYAAHALYIRPPYAIESRWPPRVRGMYAVHTPLVPWIRNGQVLIRGIIRRVIAIHTPYAPHVRHPCVIDTQLIRNTYEIVAPEMFHQTISAILLRICYFFVRLMSAVASPANGTERWPSLFLRILYIVFSIITINARSNHAASWLQTRRHRFYRLNSIHLISYFQPYPSGGGCY